VVGGLGKRGTVIFMSIPSSVVSGVYGLMAGGFMEGFFHGGGLHGVFMAVFFFFFFFAWLNGLNREQIVVGYLHHMT
jgi:TRAP-type C4-dicarboxylate transport system permease large subunit